jgi:hypothetical protein
LHAYQWFWLRGRFLITGRDIAFWAILAIGVLLNVLYEAKNTRRLQSLKVHRTWRGELGRAVRTIAMFVFICLLWSLWNATSFDEWLSMLGMARFVSPLQAAYIGGGLLLVGAAAVALGRSSSERTDAPAKINPAAASREFWQSVVKTGGLAVVLLVVDQNAAALAPTSAIADTLSLLSSDRLNERDVAKLERGYYEDLLDEERFNPALAEIYTGRPFLWGVQSLGSTRKDNRYPNEEYFPNARATQDNGALWTTNRFGMRDRDYDPHKPPGTYRIALVGDSNSAGHHVADAQVFEQIVEARLNRDAASRPPRYEIVNFSIASYGLYARLRILPRVLEFEPDALLCVGLNELDWVARDVGRCVANHLPIPDPFVADVARRAGLKPGTAIRVSEHKLEPYTLELASWCYRRMAEECRPRGVRLFAAFLPRLDDRQWEKDQLPQLIRAAQDAGFTVIDLTPAYNGVGDWQTLWAWRWDAHPNADAHRLIADLLYEKLTPLVVPASSEPSPGPSP